MCAREKKVFSCSSCLLQHQRTVTSEQEVVDQVDHTEDVGEDSVHDTKEEVGTLTAPPAEESRVETNDDRDEVDSCVHVAHLCVYIYSKTKVTHTLLLAHSTASCSSLYVEVVRMVEAEVATRWSSAAAPCSR